MQMPPNGGYMGYYPPSVPMPPMYHHMGIPPGIPGGMSGLPPGMQSNMPGAMPAGIPPGLSNGIPGGMPGGIDVMAMQPMYMPPMGMPGVAPPVEISNNDSASVKKKNTSQWALEKRRYIHIFYDWMLLIVSTYN